MHGTTEFGVRGRSEKGDQAIEEEDHEEPGTGYSRGDTGEHKNAGADHRTDADHGDVDQPHLAAQANFGVHSGQLRATGKGLRMKTPSPPRLWSLQTLHAVDRLLPHPCAA